MKTTLEIPDDLMRTIKVRAARENLKLKDLVADLLRRGLSDASDRQARPGTRVQLPLICTMHPAARGEQLTPERVHQILTQQDMDSVRR